MGKTSHDEVRGWSPWHQDLARPLNNGASGRAYPRKKSRPMNLDANHERIQEGNRSASASA